MRRAVLTEERRTRVAVIRASGIRPEWHPWARVLEDLAITLHREKR